MDKNITRRFESISEFHGIRATKTFAPDDKLDRY